MSFRPLLRNKQKRRFLLDGNRLKLDF